MTTPSAGLAAAEQPNSDDVRVVAVDWSGAIAGSRRRIWLAESDGASVVRLECGRTREALIQHLIDLSQVNPRFVVGLDFAFSLPEWFVCHRGLGSALDLWGLAQNEAEQWLRDCPPPFWGRNGVKKGVVEAEFRRTELAVPEVAGIRPKSVFQVNFPGAVGTGSLRGLPFLKRLHEAKFSIWPFDPPAWPLVVEIYPRILTGAISKSNESARVHYLASRGFDMHPEILAKAVSCEDAFDAVVSAIAMAKAWDQLTNLEATRDRQLRLEGIIWHPAWDSDN